MRTLKLVMSMSLDGFVSGPDGEIDWVFSGDQEAMAWKVDILSDASLHVMGSRTFADMASFWPTAVNPFAAVMNQIPKAVFSKQDRAGLLAAAGKPRSGDTQAAPLLPGAESWAQAAVAGGDLGEEIAALKARDGKPIIVHGGATFARSLIAHNLVDEYVLIVCPVLLGKGRPIFSDLPARLALKLVSAKTFPSGFMAQVYRSA